MEEFDFGTRENILRHQVIGAESGVEAGDIFAVTDIGERVVAANSYIRTRIRRLRNANAKEIDVDVTRGVDLRE
jgi:predicted RNA-binding protein with PUA domain